MAVHEVGAEEISAHRRTTTAGIPATVVFAGRRPTIEVANLSSDPEALIFFTVDGSVPVVDGARTTLVAPGGVVEVRDTRPGNESIVQLISPVAATYSVTAAAR